VHTPWVAEWWNTLSSVPIALAGLWSLYVAVTQGYPRRFWVGPVFLLLTGIGSISFHGTLQYTGQAVDELSMVFTVTAFCYSVVELESRTRYKWLPYALALYITMFTMAYALVPAYFTMFVGTFIVMSAVAMYRTLMLSFGVDSGVSRWLFYGGAALYMFAFFALWIPDFVACETVGFLHLHAWFHVCCSIAPVWMSMVVIYRYFKVNKIAAAAKASALEHDIESGAHLVPRVVFAESLWSFMFPHVQLSHKRHTA
jgi:dihydroceramidase